MAATESRAVVIFVGCFQDGRKVRSQCHETQHTGSHVRKIRKPVGCLNSGVTHICVKFQCEVTKKKTPLILQKFFSKTHGKEFHVPWNSKWSLTAVKFVNNFMPKIVFFDVDDNMSSLLSIHRVPTLSTVTVFYAHVFIYFVMPSTYPLSVIDIVNKHTAMSTLCCKLRFLNSIFKCSDSWRFISFLRSWICLCTFTRACYKMIVKFK